MTKWQKQDVGTAALQGEASAQEADMEQENDGYYETKSGKRRKTHRKNGKLTEAVGGEAAIEYPTITGFAPSGNAIWVQSQENSEQVWRPLFLDTGKLGEPLSRVKGFESLARDRPSQASRRRIRESSGPTGIPASFSSAGLPPVQRLPRRRANPDTSRPPRMNGHLAK